MLIYEYKEFKFLLGLLSLKALLLPILNQLLLEKS